MHYLHVKTNYNILTSKRKFYRKKQYVPRHLPKINRVTVPENPEWSIIFLPNGPIWMLVERISSALLCCIRHGRHSVSGWSLISCCRQHAARILTRTDLCHHTSGVSALNTFVESFKHRQKLLEISMLKWLKVSENQQNLTKGVCFLIVKCFWRGYVIILHKLILLLTG